jgi:hypothetical protein
MGPPGVGKTHLAIGLGHAVVAAGYRVYYTPAADLVAAMHAAFLEGTWTQKLRFYTAPSLLVIDELGYLPMDRPLLRKLGRDLRRRRRRRRDPGPPARQRRGHQHPRRELPDAHPPPPTGGDSQGGDHQTLTDLNHPARWGVSMATSGDSRWQLTRGWASHRME